MIFARPQANLCLLLLCTAVQCGLAGCDRTSRYDVVARLDAPFPGKLSEWHLFSSTSPVLKPNRGVLPYDLNTPLFSDYARKYRFVWMPAGTSARYADDGPFGFPPGTILAKTFAFPVDGRRSERLVETRLLVHARNGWVGLPYIWNDKQSDATLQLVPNPVPVSWTDPVGKRHEFTYAIPNVNECHECHDNQRVMLPIGPKARNLNKLYAYTEGTEDQLERWQRIGYLQGLPQAATRPKAAKWDDASSGTLSERARAYLDNNCAHCHQPGGQAGYTGVDFRLTQSGLSLLGACKQPNSAGNMGDRLFDLVPGGPDESILIYRLESTAPKVSMPQLSRAVVHEEGVQLLREWIASLPGACRPNGQLVLSQ
jgi:uncharacterized repeat protein (TIGR03806 family)